MLSMAGGYYLILWRGEFIVEEGLKDGGWLLADLQNLQQCFILSSPSMALMLRSLTFGFQSLDKR